MQIIINIGLKNNPFTAQQIIDRINNNKSPIFFISGSDIKSSQYKYEAESTLVIKLITREYSHSTLLRYFEDLSSVLNQECIAVKTDGLNCLAYNKSYSGQKIDFNDKYFIEL